MSTTLPSTWACWVAGKGSTVVWILVLLQLISRPKGCTSSCITSRERIKTSSMSTRWEKREDQWLRKLSAVWCKSTSHGQVNTWYMSWEYMKTRDTAVVYLWQPHCVRFEYKWCIPWASAYPSNVARRRTENRRRQWIATSAHQLIFLWLQYFRVFLEALNAFLLIHNIHIIKLRLNRALSCFYHSKIWSNY